MLDKNVAVSVLNTQALARAKINAENFKNGIDKKLKYGESKCARYVKKALIAGGASAKNSGIESAKNYGPWLLENNFKVVGGATTVCTGGVFTISGQQVGDVVVIQAAPHHVHGHMAMFNGTHWVSDFVQERGSILPRYIVIKTYPIHFIVMAIIPHQSSTPRLPKKEKLKLSGRSLLITGEVSSIIRKRSSLMSGGIHRAVYDWP